MARETGVCGLDGRIQAYTAVFTASSGTSSNSPVLEIDACFCKTKYFALVSLGVADPTKG